ncbi:MAG: prenyltransferase [Steroidobacteraceae bacterium]|jgi:1,4-dihydroxy-2-naphthoate octaprenyltransferase|nr:prenyltransferase [Steroidobacteraceae bacterium]
MSQPAEPVLATFGGSAPGQVLRRYWMAMRPAFLTASIMPVVVGTAWGHAAAGGFDVAAALLALLATALVHAGANVLNDVGDEIGGSDRLNTERIFPYTGGSRCIQNGVMSLPQMRRFGVGLVAAAMLLGAVLALLKGPTVVVLGLVGIALGVAYSLPPLSLASRGVGELTIAAGFGALPVMGAAWLQSGRFDLPALLVSMPTAMWVTAILLINEVPDLRADALAGKRTWPVRVGLGGTRAIYLGLHSVAIAAAIAMVVRGQLHWGVLLLSVPLFLLSIGAARGIVAASGPGRDRLRASIEKTLGIHALGSAWIAAWAWFGS